ncbi:MAG: arylsulfotransferase family protein [Planctomycetota bacterium]
MDSRNQLPTWLILASLAGFVACSDSSTPIADDAGRQPDDSELAAFERPDPETSKPKGMWYARRDAPETPEQLSAAKALEGIGYASGSEEARDTTGVLTLIEDRVRPGLNLWSAGHAPEAYLMDMHGEILHRWRVDPQELWADDNRAFGFTRKARLTRDGDLLMVFAGRGVVALDWNSKVLWSYDAPAHHDVAELPDGTLVTLDRKASVFPELHPTRVLLDDRIVFLDPETGELEGAVSLFDSLLRSEFAEAARADIAAFIQKGLEQEQRVREANPERFANEPDLEQKLDLVGDVLHSNSITRIGAKFAARSELLEEGWFLVSIRNLNALAAVEVDARRQSGTVRWYRKGDWAQQHEAIALENGRILLFDNAGRRGRKGQARSRVIEIDPASGEIIESIDQVEGRSLISLVAGASLRLDNGNTLIVESTGGTVYEVDSQGQCVWKFVCPARAGENDEYIAMLCHVIRVDESDVAEWLDR